MTRRTPAHARDRRETIPPLVAVAAFVLVLVFSTWIGLKAASVPARSADGPGALGETSAQGDLQSEEGTLRTCTAIFEGPGSPVSPVELHEGELHPDLPIPKRSGYVFAGWYESPEAAQTLDVSQRVNMARMVDCQTPRKLTSGWVTPEENLAEATEVPILMYHYVTTYPGQAQEKERPNLYVEPEDLEEQVAYIRDTGFYLPSWKELSAFIDGELYLPQRSVVITADDGHKTWWEIAVPILEEHEVMSTAFLVTSRDVGPQGFPYVLRRSHTSSLHSTDGGEGPRMLRWSEQEIKGDLETSAAELGGLAEVLAYPYGQTNDTAKAAAAAAGYEMGRLAAEGYVRIGTEKFSLPMIQVRNGESAQELAERIG
mgnify:CR=1 FL=1